jgi:peroxiredoxin
MFRILLSLFILVVSLPSIAQQAGKGLTQLPDRPQAPDFVLADIDGNQYRLSDYRGQVVIINFWATWCPPCRAEMPSMQRAWQQLEKEGILMLGINVGEDEDTIFQFTANYPVEFPLLMDQDSRVINQWPVRDDPDLLAMVRALKQ